MGLKGWRQRREPVTLHRVSAPDPNSAPLIDLRPSAETRQFTAVLHRRYGLYVLGLVVFVLGLALLERTGWPRSWIGGTFLIATVVVYAVIGLMSRTTDESEYYVAGRRVPAVYNGMATAADWMSAASFIGTAGVLYLQGFAGLAYILGWTGGYCLVALLLAPYLRRLGSYTIPEFLGQRYGGTWPRVIGVVFVVLVSFVYVVVQIYGVGLITSHLTGFNFEIGVFVGLGGVLVCSFLGGMRAVTWTQVAQYIVLIVAYLTPVVWLSMNQTGSPLAWMTYGEQLQQVTRHERRLLVDEGELEVRRELARRSQELERKLGDVPLAMKDDARRQAAEVQALRQANASYPVQQQAERQYAQRPLTENEARQRYERELRTVSHAAGPLAGVAPQAEPFALGQIESDGQRDGAAAGHDLARRNFLALVFCLMLGTAALPHVLTRYHTTPTVREARWSVVWSLVFITVLYLAAPALAVLVKHEVLSHLVGTPFSELPAWILRWGKLDPALVSVEDINGDGLLQWSELKLGGDVIVLAAPEIGGLPAVVTYLVAAGGLAAALSTADGLLLTIANSLSRDLYHRVFKPQAAPIRRVMVSKFLVLVVALLAAFIASMRFADILQFVSAAFSLAASGFFPALVMGIFWRRASRAGAVAGMLSGLLLCAYYMATNHPLLRHLLDIRQPLESCSWWGIDAVAAGVFGVPAGVLTVAVVSLLRPDRGAAHDQQALAVTRIRYPDPL